VYIVTNLGISQKAGDFKLLKTDTGCPVQFVSFQVDTEVCTLHYATNRKVAGSIPDEVNF
jgi:hypothetical protein